MTEERDYRCGGSNGKKNKKIGEINFSDIYSTWSQEKTVVTVALASGDKRRMAQGGGVAYKVLSPLGAPRHPLVNSLTTQLTTCIMENTRTLL